jgi:hypothetical protein
MRGCVRTVQTSDMITVMIHDPMDHGTRRLEIKKSVFFSCEASGPGGGGAEEGRPTHTVCEKKKFPS